MTVEAIRPHSDRMLKIACAIVGRRHSYDLSPKQILLARHMANDGATLRQVMAALGWCCDVHYARRVLMKSYRINPRPDAQAKAHRGNRTTLPENPGQKTLAKIFRAGLISA